MDLLGRVLGNRPFERPWMINYLDTDLAVDAGATYERLEWRPQKTAVAATADAVHGGVPQDQPRTSGTGSTAPPSKRSTCGPTCGSTACSRNISTRICTAYLDQMLSPGSAARFPSYQGVPRDVLEWRFMILLRHLQSSIRTRDRGLFTTYCRDLAEKRLMQGFGVREVVGALLVLNGICVDTAPQRPGGRGSVIGDPRLRVDDGPVRVRPDPRDLRRSRRRGIRRRLLTSRAADCAIFKLWDTRISPLAGRFGHTMLRVATPGEERSETSRVRRSVPFSTLWDTRISPLAGRFGHTMLRVATPGKRVRKRAACGGACHFQHCGTLGYRHWQSRFGPTMLKVATPGKRVRKRAPCGGGAIFALSEGLTFLLATILRVRQ